MKSFIDQIKVGMKNWKSYKESRFKSVKLDLFSFSSGVIQLMLPEFEKSLLVCWIFTTKICFLEIVLFVKQFTTLF